MGLDITAYSELKKAEYGNVFDEFGEIADGFVQFYVNTDFPGRADDVIDITAYEYNDALDFRAGSYGGYNSWRDKLAEMAGYSKSTCKEYGRTRESFAATIWNNPSPGPFMELINFSDCEGVIGTTISKKLAADFSEYQSKADAHQDAHFREKYAEWRAAFELASNNGAVKFY